MGTVIDNFCLPVIKKYEKLNKLRNNNKSKRTPQSPTYVFPLKKQKKKILMIFSFSSISFFDFKSKWSPSSGVALYPKLL